MKDKHAQFIDVAALRRGIYVYLDVGWLGHPFALNSFRITSVEQVETIRSLGFERIRYSPEQSISEEEFDRSVADAGHQQAPAASAQPPDPARAAATDTVPVARSKRREAIAAQRASLQRCENQFNDASRSFKQIVDAMHSRPEEALARGVAVINDMMGQMGDANEETYVRLLSEKAGEKTSLHSINVAIISMLLGKALRHSAEELLEIGIGALLHDLGKIELPDRLRWNQGELSSAERALYREHVAKGVELARKMRLSVAAQHIVAQHHEQADGLGFPMRLKGDEITPGTRIVSLVNRYDNLCNPGNPTLAVTPHEALAQIYAQRKTDFDLKVLNIFVRLMGVYPPGSIVELSDGRFAMVVSVNSSRPLRPRVMVHDVAIPAEEALVADLETMPELGIRRSLKPLQLPKASHDYLSPRKRLCYFFERGRQAPEQGEPP